MKTWIIWALFWLLFFYNLVDAHHTKLLILTGQVYEANPFMGLIIENAGLNSIFIVKVFVFLVVGVLLFKCQKAYRHGCGGPASFPSAQNSTLPGLPGEQSADRWGPCIDREIHRKRH